MGASLTYMRLGLNKPTRKIIKTAHEAKALVANPNDMSVVPEPMWWEEVAYFLDLYIRTQITQSC